MQACADVITHFTDENRRDNDSDIHLVSNPDPGSLVNIVQHFCTSRSFCCLFFWGGGGGGGGDTM